MQEAVSKGHGLVGGAALDPISRTSEILFGLIMVLSFTCSLSAVEAGQSDVQAMLIGALGCNIAWGIIDAFFYLINVAAQRGRELHLVQMLKRSSEQRVARELYESILPESVLGSLTPQSYAELREHLLKRYGDTKVALLTIADFRSAFVVFMLVFLSTFPVAIPFIVVPEIEPALRLSNAIALGLLFWLGLSLGRYAGRRSPWVWGLMLMFVGIALVLLTIALGG